MPRLNSGRSSLSIDFGENALLGFFYRSRHFEREIHGDRLAGIDGDGVEDDLARSAPHVEGIKQIFYADVVRGEGGG